MSFRPGQRVFMVTAFKGVATGIVVREQMSEGPRPFWPAVRIIPDGAEERYPDGFNWPREDVFATRKEALAKAKGEVPAST